MVTTTTGSVTSKSESESINFGLFSSLLSPSNKVPMTESQDIELIARAASQATIAARSIILSGGTQSTALSTAKAAALSIIHPKGQNVGTPSGFLGRRKSKREAHVIAAMALGQVNSALQHRSNDSQLLDSSISNRHFQNVDTQSYFGSTADSFFQDSKTSVRSENRMSNSFLFSNKKGPSTETVPQVPSASGASTVASKSSKDAAQPETNSEQKNTTTNEMQPTVTSIFTTLASLSDIGSRANSTSSNKNSSIIQESPSSQIPVKRGFPNVLKKKPVDVVKSPVKSTKFVPTEGIKVPTEGIKVQTAVKKVPPKSRMRSLISKLPSAEDPIYHGKQKVKRTKKQPFSVSKRMQQFLHSSSFDTNDDQISDADYDSYGDSYSGGSSTYGSQDERAEDTGTMDSGTIDSEGSSFVTEKNNDTITMESEDKDFFASNTTSSMFSTFSEKFLCSPVAIPRDTSIMATRQDSRDDGERLRDSVLLATVGLREQEESVCTDDSSMYDDDTYTCDDTATYADTVHDSVEEVDEHKKSYSMQDSMEQLVLRALSATPAPSTLSVARSNNGSEAKSKDDEAEVSVSNTKPFPLNHVSSSFSVARSRSQISKKMNLPWLGKKSARTVMDKKQPDSVSN